MLNVSEQKMAEIIKLGGGEVVNLSEMTTFLKKEDEVDFKECPHLIMAQFLNGLIFFKRGQDASKPQPPLEIPITNNIVLKKLRVAFELKEDDIIAILLQVGFRVSKAEFSAFFRKVGHHNYRACGDQFLRNFLKGLTHKIRASG